MEFSEKLINILQDRVKHNGDCIEWTGYITKDGYGLLHYNYIKYQVHRLYYELYKGEIPKGLWVCHTCDNRKCVNPDHLFLGDAKDNYDDMYNKGRRKSDKGDLNPMAKLTWDDVEEIRSLLVGGETITDVADYFGISRQNVWMIKTNKRWII